MTNPTRIRKQLAITLELVVEVEGEFREPDTDVGEQGLQTEDLTILAIGTNHNEPDGMVDWAPEACCPGRPGPQLDTWLTGCIIEQCGDHLEEQLLQD